MKSELVAVFVFPATSLATPAATENLTIPAIPPAPVAFDATKFIDDIAAVVNAVVVMAQPADSAFFVISEISSPLTLSLNVTVTVTETVGMAGVAVKLPPETICEDVKVTVGRVASIFTFANAADAAVVVPPSDCVAVIEYVPSAIVGNVQLLVVVVATKVQVTVAPDAGTAVSVTVAPTVKEPMFIVGVLSFVILSLFEVPLSDAASSVGVAGATKAPIAIVRVSGAKIGVSPFPPNS
jgi:hypothetical protein